MARRRITREMVAEVVRVAQSEGINETLAVVEMLDISEARARYHIRMARADGVLPADEEVHRYTEATIHRGTRRERTFQVCQVCLSNPCQVGQAAT